jgi:hypothetical protein
VTCTIVPGTQAARTELSVLHPEHPQSVLQVRVLNVFVHVKGHLENVTVQLAHAHNARMNINHANILPFSTWVPAVVHLGGRWKETPRPRRRQLIGELVRERGPGALPKACTRPRTPPLSLQGYVIVLSTSNCVTAKYSLEIQLFDISIRTPEMPCSATQDQHVLFDPLNR